MITLMSNTETAEKLIRENEGDMSTEVCSNDCLTIGVLNCKLYSNLQFNTRLIDYISI